MLTAVTYAQINHVPRSPIQFDSCDQTDFKAASSNFVVISYRIRPDGSIEDVEGIKSSGEPRLVEIALRLLRSCRASIPSQEELSAGRLIQESVRISSFGQLRSAAGPLLVNVGKCTPTEEDYPELARQKYEQGTATVEFSIDSEGKLVSSSIAKSSGSHRLNQRSLEMLRLCEFMAGRRLDGTPVGGTFNVDYVWRLRR